MSPSSPDTPTPAVTGRDIVPYRQYIESALAYGGGTHTFADIQAGVDAGTLQAWPGRGSMVVTELINTPQKKILHFFLAGGNLADLEAMSPHLLEWGRQQGCTAATLTGRRGWERTFLLRDGWAPKLVVFEKAL